MKTEKHGITFSTHTDGKSKSQDCKFCKVSLLVLKKRKKERKAIAIGLGKNYIWQIKVIIKRSFAIFKPNRMKYFDCSNKILLYSSGLVVMTTRNSTLFYDDLWKLPKSEELSANNPIFKKLISKQRKTEFLQRAWKTRSTIILKFKRKERQRFFEKNQPIPFLRLYLSVSEKVASMDTVGTRSGILWRLTADSRSDSNLWMRKTYESVNALNQSLQT